MSANGWLQFAIYSLVLLLTVRPVGVYLARVLEGDAPGSIRCCGH
jgi:K+-transporting ATPase A subunit